MKKFSTILLILLITYLPTLLSAQEEDIKIRESEQGVLLEFTKSKACEVSTMSELENPARLILTVKNCALSSDSSQDFSQNSLFKKIKIRVRDNDCQITLNLQNISWQGRQISKPSPNLIIFGNYIANKEQAESTLSQNPEPTPAPAIAPEPSPSPDSTPESVPATEPPVLSSPQVSPSPFVTSDEKLLSKISFNTKEKALLLDFTSRPSFELKKRSDLTYQLNIDDFSTSDPALLLPYYAPASLPGFQKLMIRDKDDLEIIIYTEENFRINASTVDNSVILTAEAQ